MKVELLVSTVESMAHEINKEEAEGRLSAEARRRKRREKEEEKEGKEEREVIWKLRSRIKQEKKNFRRRNL